MATRSCHKLVDVVIAAVVDAVDVGWPSTPASPLAIADPTLSEANHPGAIRIDAIAEPEVRDAQDT